MRVLGFPVHVRRGFLFFMGLIVVLYGDQYGLWLAGSIAAFTLLHEVSRLSVHHAGLCELEHLAPIPLPLMLSFMVSLS